MTNTRPPGRSRQRVSVTSLVVCLALAGAAGADARISTSAPRAAKLGVTTPTELKLPPVKLPGGVPSVPALPVTVPAVQFPGPLQRVVKRVLHTAATPDPQRPTVHTASGPGHAGQPATHNAGPRTDINRVARPTSTTTARTVAGRRPRRPRSLGGATRSTGTARRLATPAGELSSMGQAVHANRPAGGVLGQIGRSIPLPLPIPDWSKPIILILSLLTVGFGTRARIASIRARRLERAERQLSADLHSMQLALVPAIPGHVGALGVSVAYRPADGVAAGGDFYDVFELDGGRVAVILGDVSGHGHAALAHAARMRYTLRAYVEAGLGPRAALKLAGSVLGAADDWLFTTVAIAIHDPKEVSLTYATAGHPHPLTLGQRAEVPVMGCSSPALGWGVRTGGRQTTIPFPVGACACFFTDGLTEARTDHGLLGRTRLAEILSQDSRPPTAPELLDRVRSEAQQAHDDMATCVIQAMAGGSPTARHIEELEVEVGQLASGAGSRFLQACGVTPKVASTWAARAHAIAAKDGLALLTVDVTHGTAKASASSPATLAAPARSDQSRAAPGSQPLSEPDAPADLRDVA